MTDQTVPELTGFQATAAELHRIADAIRDLPCSRKKPYLSLAILPTENNSSTEQKIADVDAVAMAVFGKPAETVENSPGNWYRLVREERVGIHISIQGLIPSPHVNELEQLRARVAELEAAHARRDEQVTGDPIGLTYSRVDDDPQVIRPHSPRLPLHTGAVVDGGQLVDETPADDEPAPPVLTAAGLTPEADLSRGPLAGTTPVVTYFSFGYGQTDPDTGKKLIDHYVTVVAPTYDGCRTAMFESRFGRAWSFDYLAGHAKTTEWVSQWTEHEVIVAPGTDPALAEAALKAAAELLTAEPVSEARWHECEDPARCGESGGHQAPEPTFPAQPVGGY